MDERSRAIEALYRRRYIGFRNAVATVTGSYESARDAVQEGFARALRARDQFRHDGVLEAWVWRIVLRVALEQKQIPIEHPLDDVLLDPRLVEPQLDPALAEAIRALPPRRRLIVFLRYFADLDYAAIAQICEIEPGTVAATLAQSRASLAADLPHKEAEQ
jgi:RNA polymerase sigma factor (sigma-70 family)